MSYPIKTIHFKDRSKLPATIIVFPIENLCKSGFVFWTPDGPNMKGFKFGFELDKKGFTAENPLTHEKSEKAALKVIDRMLPGYKK